MKTAYHLAKLGYLPDEFVEFMEDKFKMTKTKSDEDKQEGN